MAPHSDQPHTGSGQNVPDIDPDDLDLPSAGPQVTDIHTEYKGAVGSETLETVLVWVVVEDDTAEEELEWSRVRPLERKIRAILHKRNPDWVPVVQYRTESEYQLDQRERT